MYEGLRRDREGREGMKAGSGLRIEGGRQAEISVSHLLVTHPISSLAVCVSSVSRGERDQSYEGEE